jgi:hypothetical protein
METQFDRRTKRAVGGIPWREALRRWVPLPRRPAGDRDQRFDALARSLAEEVPRREAMRRLGAGLTTAVLASLGLESAWGDPKTPKCKKGYFLCLDGHCCPIGQQCCGSFCCPSGSPCCGGACCQLGQTCCAGLTGTEHCATIGSYTDCSGCNDVCKSDETCLGAQCVCSGNLQPRCEADNTGRRRCSAAGEKCCGPYPIPETWACCYSAVLPGINDTALACPPSETCCLGPATANPLDRNVHCCTSTQTCCPSGDCVTTGTACP